MGKASVSRKRVSAQQRVAAIGVRTTPAIKEAAEKAAAAERRTLSQWVELAIIQALEAKRKQ